VYRPKSETQNLDARISKQLAERLEALARRRGVARAALVRELLEEAVEET
jgi:predicted DNA-binding protein